MLPSQTGGINYSLRRYFVDRFHFQNVPSIAPGSRVLDLGGEKIQKRGQFDIERFDLSVIYVNFSVTKQPDVQADAALLPFVDGSFDAAICSELLEHVPDPVAVLRQVHRVLHKGGVLLISVPFLHRIHGDPSDYGRYTDHYWQENLVKIGFSSITIERQGLFWSVLMDMLRDWVSNLISDRLRFSPRTGWAATKLIGWGARRAIARDTETDRRDYPFLANYTTGFGVRAVKP